MPLNDPMFVGAIVYIVAIVVFLVGLLLLDRLAGRRHDQLTPPLSDPPRRERLAIEARKQPVTSEGTPEDERHIPCVLGRTPSHLPGRRQSLRHRSRRPGS